MNMLLANKKCVPCGGGVAALKPDVIKQYLAQVSGWNVAADTRSIEKDFQFKDFARALAFVNKVGAVAEKENHHPDISLHGWNKVKLTLSTHAIGGLSENDFILGAKIDGL